MTPELERLAEEAGVCYWSLHGRPEPVATFSTEALARFADLVRAQALTEAARVCEAIAAANEYAYADECAAAIRALGDTK